MKKSNLLTFVCAISLVFASCSTEENQLTETSSKNLLKTFKVKKDATGAYSVNYDVQDNVKVDQVLNITTNTSKFYLIPTNDKTKNNLSQDLTINNSQIKIGFVDTQNNNSPEITVFDDIKFASKSDEDQVKLNSYSILSNEDGTYDLDFSVKNNVDVSFVYNAEISTYEVHLEEGKGGEISYNRNFESLDGVSLKIDFVNHINNNNAKTDEPIRKVRKPKVIIDNGNND